MNYVQPIRDRELLEAVKEVLKEDSYRNYMLFVLGINTGLRISDILALKKKDVYGKEQLVILEKKTNKRKFLQITPTLQKEIRKYCRSMSFADDEYLFPSREGENQPLTRSMAYKILRGATEPLGIQHVGTHTLRKTFGYHFYLKTKNVAILQKIFNHSSPEITLIYIGIDQDTMDDAMKNFGL